MATGTELSEALRAATFVSHMTPLYDYAPRGQRAYGKVPRNYGASMTLIASLSLSGMGEAMLLDGAADAAAFQVYIEQRLSPSLKPGQIVILDNLSIHLGSRVKQAIEAKGCRLLLLPAYSPDFSPIEEAFSKVKTVLRRQGARTREALQEAIWPGVGPHHGSRCSRVVPSLWLSTSWC